MTPYTFLFFGKSGSGKGTQAKLLAEYLKKKDPERQVEYIETGAKLREFSDEVGLTAQLTKKVMTEGGLLPSFVPIWIWTNYFVRYLDGSEHLILDGLSRRSYEAPVLDDALKFFNREKPFVIILNVSDHLAREHLLSRGRSDDNKLDIDSRLDWFKTNVDPTIDYFKKNSYYTVLEIDGEQSIKEVHQEILKRAGI
ncbi:MAG: adk, adenylate kinase, adenylate kinase [Candidatus Paceibacter sp.]|jgi:adenylate kinase family enzyme|nr:adk, adenylate kinase, adenylate kinase [Candidatus Paceibacter sp.]